MMMRVNSHQSDHTIMLRHDDVDESRLPSKLPYHNVETHDDESRLPSKLPYHTVETWS